MAKAESEICLAGSDQLSNSYSKNWYWTVISNISNPYRAYLKIVKSFGDNF